MEQTAPLLYFSFQLMLDTLTTQRWFMTPANTHSQQTSPACAPVCVLNSCDWLSCLSCLWHFLKCNLFEQHGRFCDPRDSPYPTAPCHVCPGSWCILAHIVFCIPLLRLPTKLNSLSSRETLPGIKLSLCDLLYPCYKQRQPSVIDAPAKCFVQSPLSRQQTFDFAYCALTTELNTVEDVC